MLPFRTLTHQQPPLTKSYPTGARRKSTSICLKLNSRSLWKHGLSLEEDMTRICCLSLESARQVLEIRWDKGQAAPVHVCGSIQAASPVTQIKDCPLFLVKLLPGVDIIIKRKELLQWHKHLVPNQEFVITDLRPTTLQKGGTRQTRVYTVTSSSQLLPAGDVTVDWLSLHEWLERNNLSCSATPSPVPAVAPLEKLFSYKWLGSNNLSCSATFSPVPAVAPLNKLFSYKGTVSQVLDRALGVFELDNAVRLHVGQVPAVPSFSTIQVGGTLTVHNAHHRQEAQSIVLYGCMLCSVTRHKQETADITKAKSLSPVLQKYLYLYQLSQHKLDFLYSLRQTLNTQLHGLLDSRGVEKIFTAILAIEALSWHQSSKGPYRNLLDEFLNVPHVCSLQGGENEESLPEYVTVAELLGSVDHPPQDTAGQWTCNRDHHKQQVLLGVVSSCERTGQWVLYDNTGTMIIVPCCIHGDNIKHTCSQKHSCSEQCSCSKNIQKGSRFPCKRLHTCCLGKVVAVRKFLPVLETVNNSLISPAVSGIKAVTCLKYLCIDLQEVVVLGEQTDNKQKQTDHKQKQTDSKQTVLGNSLRAEKQAENQTAQDDCIDELDPAVNNRQTTNDGAVEKNNLQSSTTSGQTNRCLSAKPCPTPNGVGHGFASRHQNAVPVLHRSLDNNKPVLHRHVQEDGSTRFCRKMGCEAVGVLGPNSGKFEEEKKKAKENIPDVVDDKESRNQRSDGNRRKRKVTEFPDSSLEEEMANISFSVKPVVRKRVGNCTVTSIDQSQCATDSDVSSSFGDNKTRGWRSTEIAHMPSDTNKVIKFDECDIACGADQRENTVPCAKQRESTVEGSSLTVRVVNKEALRRDGQKPNSKALMTCVDCVLLGDNIQQTKVMFQGPSLQWLPGLYPGHTYRLTVPDGSPPLMTPHAGNKKLRQTVERSNTQLLRVANDRMNMEELFETEEDSSSEQGHVSAAKRERVLGKDYADVEGVIVRRSLVKRDQQQPNMQDRSRGDNVNTRLDVREATSGQIVQVYLDHGNMFLPLGLIPGALVSLRRLERIVSRSGNVYYRLAHLTSAHIKCITTTGSTQQAGEPAMVETGSGGGDGLEPVRLYLVELWKEQSGEPVWKGVGQGRGEKVFECVCQVCQVAKLSLKCVCEFCSSTVVKARCSNVACFGGESATFLARASVIVDDGTCVAMVTMSGECVRSLLQLSGDQWSALEQESKMTGEVFIQQAKRALDSPMEQLAYMLCDNRLVKRPWLMRLRRRAASKDSLNLDLIDLDEFAQKTFDVGSTRITTHCLPFLQLECMAMETFNPTAGSNFYLANV